MFVINRNYRSHIPVRCVSGAVACASAHARTYINCDNT